MYWQKDIETAPREDLERLQLERLWHTVAMASGADFYRQRFSEAGFQPQSLRSLDDLRRIPFTTKEDLRSGFPYRFLCVGLEQCVRLHSSSGTTGRITVIFHTQGDIDNWTELLSRSMYATGMRTSDVFQNMMSYGLFTGGLGFHYGAERLGALVLPTAAGNSKRQIFFMKNLGTTVIHIIPSYALSLLNTFAGEGVDPKEDVALRIAFLGAEPHSEATRRKVEEAYGLEAFNSYGLSEMNGPGVAFECARKAGMHVWEDAYILEVIDPATGEPVPDGEEGELVFTNLTREGMPLLRYRSRDLASVYPEPCPCGRTHRRISRIKGRVDDMFIIKGVNVFPMQVEKALMEIPEVGNNFVIVLERNDRGDQITVKVEVNPASFTGDVRALTHLQERIRSRLRSEILVTPKVELLEPQSLPATEGKAVRVRDNREL